MLLPGATKSAGGLSRAVPVVGNAVDVDHVVDGLGLRQLGIGAWRQAVGKIASTFDHGVVDGLDVAKVVVDSEGAVILDKVHTPVPGDEGKRRDVCTVKKPKNKVV